VVYPGKRWGRVEFCGAAGARPAMEMLNPLGYGACEISGVLNRKGIKVAVN
jgi:hypothetical protein